MESKLNEESVKLVVDYVQSNYKIEEVLKDYNLIGADETGSSSSLVISCLKKAERTPSLKINLDLNIFKCFSCGASGNIISFKTYCERELKRRNVTYYSIMEEMLKKDKEMQLRLGINTIFMNVTPTMQDIIRLNAMKSTSFKNANFKPKNFLELSRILKQRTNNIDVLITAISLMESGVPPDKILDLVLNEDKKESSLSQKDINRNIDILKNL